MAFEKGNEKEGTVPHEASPHAGGQRDHPAFNFLDCSCSNQYFTKVRSTRLKDGKSQKQTPEDIVLALQKELHKQNAKLKEESDTLKAESARKQAQIDAAAQAS